MFLGAMGRIGSGTELEVGGPVDGLRDCACGRPAEGGTGGTGVTCGPSPLRRATTRSLVANSGATSAALSNAT